MPKYLDVDFLEFLEPEDGIPKDVDITTFIMKNFPIPNLKDLDTSYYDTDALKFLRKSENNGYFSYYQEKLSPIDNKWVYESEGKKNRYWFDTIKSGLKEPVFARITDFGMQYLYDYRTNEILKITNKSIVETNKAVKRSLYAQIVIGVISTLAIVLTAVYAIMAYKKDEPKSLKEINALLQKQEQVLDSIRQSQKNISTSLKIITKKTSPKKP